MQYKSVQKSLPEIARELKVDAVIEGSVMQSGRKVKVTVRLIEAKTDRNLWSKSYERDLSDVMILQSELAKAIAKEIKIAVTPAERAMLATASAVNPEAYQFFLKGRQLHKKQTEEDLRKAIDFFNKTIAIDSNYALAYAGMAEAYIMLGSYNLLPPGEVYPRAKEAAEKALEIDETLAEAYTLLAVVKFLYDWDWFDAESDFNWALGLNPSYADTHHWYGVLLEKMGRFDEANSELSRAQELNPFSSRINTNTAEMFFSGRQFDKAIEQCQKVLELDANYLPARSVLGFVYLQQEMFEEAIAEFHKLVNISKGHLEYLSGLSFAYARGGDPQQARQILNSLLERSKQSFVPQYEIALVYAALEEKDKAFIHLERAFEERSTPFINLKVDPRLDSLYSDPRLSDLLEKIGLD